MGHIGQMGTELHSETLVLSGFQYFSQRSLRSSGAVFSLRSPHRCERCEKPNLLNSTICAFAIFAVFA